MSKLTLTREKFIMARSHSINSHGGTATDARKAFQLITDHSIDTGALISDNLPLSQIHQALEKMIAGEVIKIALHPEP